MQINARSKQDLSYYMVRWLAFGACAGLFSPVTPHEAMTTGVLWGMKTQHFIWGLLFGAACGYAFTWSQNRFNVIRDKKTTWSIALAFWMGFNIAFAGMSML